MYLFIWLYWVLAVALGISVASYVIFVAEAYGLSSWGPAFSVAKRWA